MLALNNHLDATRRRREVAKFAIATAFNAVCVAQDIAVVVVCICTDFKGLKIVQVYSSQQESIKSQVCDASYHTSIGLTHTYEGLADIL